MSVFSEFKNKIDNAYQKIFSRNESLTGDEYDDIYLLQSPDLIKIGNDKRCLLKLWMSTDRYYIGDCQEAYEIIEKMAVMSARHWRSENEKNKK